GAVPVTRVGTLRRGPTDPDLHLCVPELSTDVHNIATAARALAEVQIDTAHTWDVERDVRQGRVTVTGTRGGVTTLTGTRRGVIALARTRGGVVTLTRTREGVATLTGTRGGV